jgi:hypothetical protein
MVDFYGHEMICRTSVSVEHFYFTFSKDGFMEEARVVLNQGSVDA